MNEPIFRIPGVIVAMAATFVAIHALGGLLDPQNFTHFMYTFSFVPARYAGAELWPGAMGSKIWTFATYAFLHADWVHVAVNSLWLLAFGTPVARRFGTGRLLVLALLCAVAGALFHWVTNLQSPVPMLGASAVVSGLMAASSRFIFAKNGSLDPFRHSPETDDSASRVAAVPLSKMLYSKQIIAFLGIWLLINFGLGISAVMAGEGQSIAWQAHIGGFLAGLLLFDALDPVRTRAPLT